MSRATAHEVLLGARLACRERVTQLTAAVLLTSVVLQAVEWSRGSGSSFGWSDGLASAVDALRLWIPLLAAATAAAWAGQRVETVQRIEMHLADIACRRVLTTAAGSASIITLVVATLATSVAVLLSSTVLVHGTTLRLPDTAELVTNVLDARMFWLLVLPPVWGWLGACAGLLLGGRTPGVAGVLGVFTLGFALERAAVTYPSAENVASVLPLGSGTELVLGTVVPRVAEPGGGILPGALVIASWCVGIGWLAVRQAKMPPHARIPLRRHPKSLLPIPGVAVGAATVGILVAVGAVVPETLSRQIPWPYKAEWLADVAHGTSPADAVQSFLRSLSTPKTARVFVSQSAWEQVHASWPDLKDAARIMDVYNITSAAGPGSVALNLGEQRTRPNGVVELPRQITLCLHKQNGRWVIRGISQLGLACEEMR